MKKAILLLSLAVLMLVSLPTHAIQTNHPPDSFININSVEGQLGRKLNLKEKIGLAILKKTLKKAEKKKGFSTTNHLNPCAEILLKSGKVLKVEIQKMTLSEVTYVECESTNTDAKTLKMTEVSQVRSAEGIVIYENEFVNMEETDNHYSDYDNRKTDPLSIIALVLAVTVYLTPIALTLGIVSLGRIRKYPEIYKGRTLALIATILSSIFMFLFLLGIVLLFLTFGV